MPSSWVRLFPWSVVSNTRPRQDYLPTSSLFRSDRPSVNSRYSEKGPGYQKDGGYCQNTVSRRKGGHGIYGDGQHEPAEGESTKQFLFQFMSMRMECTAGLSGMAHDHTQRALRAMSFNRANYSTTRPLILDPYALLHDFAICSAILFQAQEAEGAENAVMLLRHLTTFIMGLQDERVSKHL